MHVMLALILPSALAQASPDPAPEATASTEKARSVSVLLGGGAAVPIGGNGAGYSVGFVQRLSLDAALSGITPLQVDVTPSRHSLTDGSGYLPDEPVPDDALVGTRDYLLLDVGARIALDFSGSGGVMDDRFHAIPFVRFGLGAGFTDTQLDVPSFVGRQEIRSKAAAPLVSLGAGCELRVKPFLSIEPAIRMQGLVARDDGEIDKQTSVGIEMRAEATVDVALNF